MTERQAEGHSDVLVLRNRRGLTMFLVALFWLFFLGFLFLAFPGIENLIANADVSHGNTAITTTIFLILLVFWGVPNFFLLAWLMRRLMIKEYVRVTPTELVLQGNNGFFPHPVVFKRSDITEAGYWRERYLTHLVPYRNPAFLVWPNPFKHYLRVMVYPREYFFIFPELLVDASPAEIQEIFSALGAEAEAGRGPDNFWDWSRSIRAQIWGKKR